MALNTLGPDAEKQGGESFRWAGKLHCVKSRVWKYIKYALLSVVIVIGALLLFLPTILYHLPILSRDGADGNRSNMSSVPTFESGYSNIQPLNCSTLKCQEAFSCSVVGNTSLCLPVCGSWSQYSNGSALAINVAFITSSAVSFILSVVVLVISCIRWKNICGFPDRTCLEYITVMCLRVLQCH